MIKHDKNSLKNKKIDIHTHSTGIIIEHLLKGRYPIVQDLFDLSDTIKRAGIDYAITFPMPISIYYNSHMYWNEKKLISDSTCDFPYKAENFTLLKCVTNCRLSNLLPFVSVSTNEKIEQQIKFIRVLSQEYPIYGIKYHTTMDLCKISDEKFNDFANIALELNLPIMIHTKIDDTANPLFVLDFAEKYPDIRVCAAHCAKLYKPFFERLEENEHKYNNVFIDCSPFIKICSVQKLINNTSEYLNLFYDNPLQVFEYLLSIIPERLIWGTDMPWHRCTANQNKISDYTDEVKLMNLIDRWELLSDNSLRFLFG